jgi:inositol 1,4,5-triphosphate receptor type 1/inositol 1,4,5-triphosphate receptor type 3
MWNYLFFIAYLNEKDETELTGNEQYIIDKLEKQDLNWFPFNKARELDGLGEDEEEEEKNRITRIASEVSC